METKFQTSFIPKKPLPTGSQGVNVGVPIKLKPVHHTSIFFNFALLIFILSFGAAGAAFGWKTILLNNRENYKQELVDKQRQFNPELIRQLKVASKRLDDAKMILAKHIAASSIFEVMSKLTAENVRFLSMEILGPGVQSTQNAQPTSATNLTIKLTGQGLNLTTVAFQAKVLSQLKEYGLENMLTNPIITDPIIELNGSVSFKLSQEINPDKIIYMHSAVASTEESATTTTQ